MKKLKTKTFYTIFLILSFFLMTILLIFNLQNYYGSKSEVRSHLMRVRGFSMPIDNNEKLPFPRENVELEDSPQRIIMDYDIYTVLLNAENNIVDIVHHSDSDSSSEIEGVVRNILEKESRDILHIGNLFFADYSYNFQSGRVLVLMNNQAVQEELFSMLKTSIIIFILFEIILFYLSKVITLWLVKPAMESYQKQKEFIADASHELKTPLAVIMASADALENDRKCDKWLDNIKQEADKMNLLITNLLDLSKLEAGVKQEAYQMQDLSKIIEKTVLTFESLAYENQLTLVDDIEKNISFCCSEVEIQELVSILLDNAIKHSDKKEKIKVNFFGKKDEIVLEVINRGDNIPKEDEEKIFERFYRIDKARNRNSNRYGLGLAIAKNIVVNHNGKISAFSKGRETTFRVVLKKERTLKKI